MTKLDAEIAEHLVAMRARLDSIRAQLDSMNEGAVDLIWRTNDVIDEMITVSICPERIDGRFALIERHVDRIGMKLH